MWVITSRALCLNYLGLDYDQFLHYLIVEDFTVQYDSARYMQIALVESLLMD